MAPLKRPTLGPLPPDYETAKLKADRWYTFGMLGAILTLISIAVGIVLSPVLTIVVFPTVFTLYAFARFAVLGQRAGRSLDPWVKTHPYDGPAPKLLGTLRMLAYTQPVVVGCGSFAILFGLFLLVIIGQHYLPK
jgi:hypothetical protein